MADRSPVVWSDVTVAELAARLDARVPAYGRMVLGLTGPPGAGKSTLGQALVEALPRPAVLLPMDGFHLADAELERLGRRDRKGAPDTFDAAGYVHLLRRIRDRADPVVYAPAFVREREEAVAGALAVPRDVGIVVTEGNYLLADGPWAAVRPLLDECWYVDCDDGARRRRLVDRHVRHGRSRGDAQAWVEHTDEPNARLVAATRKRADAVVRPAPIELNPRAAPPPP